MNTTRQRRLLPTLMRSGDPLADPAAQRQRLASITLPRTFDEALTDADLLPLAANGIEILQINVGKRCNQTCRHCHVDAGPERNEVMPRGVLEAALEFLTQHRIPKLDVTGGAPELHPDFREIVERAALSGAHVMHRCNLTAILLPNYASIPELLAHHRVEVIASLPYFQQRETDAQRGDGVFEQSLTGLRRLNELGYGRGNGLQLNLVTNPVGTYLPAAQASLEAHWKRELDRRYGISFDRLFTITNMPISRFLQFLEEKGRTSDYMTRLANAFNPATAAGLMCRTMISVAWDGRLYDCDFNQMLDLGLARADSLTIFDANHAALATRRIATGSHCFGCTAGAGSSCGGALT